MEILRTVLDGATPFRASGVSRCSLLAGERLAKVRWVRFLWVSCTLGLIALSWGCGGTSSTVFPDAGTGGSAGGTQTGGTTSTGGAAGVCVSDADCPTGNRCDRATGDCVPIQPQGCTSSADCAARTDGHTRCDVGTGACVECVTSTDCGTGQVCTNHACAAGQTCTNSLDCPTGQVCNTATELCVACVIDADCGTNARCAANICRPLCDSDKDCTPVGMLCNVSAGICVNCLDDSGCKSEEYCSQGGCLPDVCAGGSSDCVNNAVVTCNSSGSGTLPPVTCAGNQVCVASNSAASCVDQVCSPLVKGCSQTGEQVVQCSDDGLSQAAIEDCGAKSQVCVAAVCKPVVCSAGNKYCVGSEVRQCSAKGDSYSVAATCTSSQYCDATSGSCKNQICTPNQAACNNAIATTCNANGSGYVTGGIDCSTSGQICVSGQCADLLCNPSTKYCSGNQIRQCSSDGLSDSLVQACASGQYCDAASVTCKALLCTPSQPACDVNVATMCNSTGSGYTGSRKDCTTTSQSCLQGSCVDTPISCAVILSTGKSSGDGTYLINPTGTQAIQVYCDMTDGGITYEQLAFGRFDATYAGYTLLGVTDLQNSRIQQAFIWSYNLQGGMKNLDTSFTSSNCCFKGPETGYIAFGSSTNNYIYPADQTGTSYHCNSPTYSSPIMRFYVQGVTTGLATAPLPTTYFSTGVLMTTACSTSSNPAFFFKRY